MLTLVIYCSIIAVCSALGGSIPSLLRLTHRRTQLILSFVSGVMLGVVLLNLLPHSIYILGSPSWSTALCLLGLLFMFFMVRMFHFHQHDLHEEHTDDDICSYSCEQTHVPAEEVKPTADFSWAGLCFGLAVHTIIDGIALATAVTAQTQNDWAPAGLAVFLAIVLHKPLDALSITSLMAAKGWNSSIQMLVNIIFALVCPLGACYLPWVSITLATGGKPYWAAPWHFPPEFFCVSRWVTCYPKSIFIPTTVFFCRRCCYWAYWWRFCWRPCPVTSTNGAATQPSCIAGDWLRLTGDASGRHD